MTFNTSAIIWDGVFVSISLIGLIANIMSISYFIKNEKNGLANKLMISLNFTDMLSIFICKTFSNLALVFYVNEVESGKELKFDSKLLLVANLTFNSSCIISGCLTFGLTLMRTIVIYNPQSDQTEVIRQLLGFHGCDVSNVDGGVNILDKHATRSF